MIDTTWIILLVLLAVFVVLWWIGYNKEYTSLFFVGLIGTIVIAIMMIYNLSVMLK